MDNQDYYRLLIENIPAVTWVTNKEGYSSYISPNVESVYGFTPQEIYNAGPDAWFKRIHPDDRQKVESAFQKLFVSDATFCLDYRIQRKDGEWIWINDRAVNRYSEDGQEVVCGLFMDITAQKAMKKELTQTNLRLHELVSASTDWLWEFDENTIFTYSSPGITKLLGYTPGEVIGKSAFDFIPSPEKEKVAREFEAIKHGQRSFTNLENTNQHKDGHLVHLESSGSPIFDDDGHFKGYRGIDRDISERKRLEDQKIHAQKMEAIGTLAAGIAHDFNNALTAIMGFSELAQLHTPSEDRVASHLNEITRASTRAQELVKQILAFSKKVDNSRTVIAMNPVIKEALSFIRATTPSTLSIKQVIDPHLYYANVDSTQIYQVIINLCTNSAQAIQANGGEITVSLTESLLETQTRAEHPHLAGIDYLKLTIADNGPGIDPQILPQIFDPYFTTKTPDEGTGLGLAIVHGVIKNHDGFLTIDNDPGNGVAFNIYLPKSQAEEPTNVMDDSGSVPTGTEHILFVDDELLITKMAVLSLENLGYKVTAMTDSESALALLADSPDKFDILVTDQTMPKLTGEQLACQAMELRRDLPVIICSGYNQIVDEVLTGSPRIKQFLNKPIKRLTLAKAIRSALDD